MIIAIIKSGIAADTAIFDDIATAQMFLSTGIWPGADAAIELPEGCGIGDSYDTATGAWTKAPEPEQPAASIDTTLSKRVDGVEARMDDNDALLLDIVYEMTLNELGGADDGTIDT